MFKRFTGKIFQKLSTLLQSKKKIVITTHYNPDGDAMGSVLGLYHYLNAKGHSVSVIVPNEYPDFLQWMPGNKNVINFTQKNSVATKKIKSAHLIFCLDFNQLNRLGDDLAVAIKKAKSWKVLIDHHLEPEDAYDFVFSYPDGCSTCELIYDFISACSDKKMISKKIAECIYTGIMTDTQSFRFSSMKPDTHRIIAQLMEAGAANDKIYEQVYENYSEDRLRLLGYCIKDKLQVFPQYQTAVIALSKTELDQYNYETGFTEGIVNYPLGIRSIRVSAFFSERDDEVKISFRSKGNYSVKKIAKKYFEGGGHKNAAGGKSLLSLDETVEKFIQLLPEIKSGLKK